MSLQRFRVKEGALPGEPVSGIMDERPELDSTGDPVYPGTEPSPVGAVSAKIGESA